MQNDYKMIRKLRRAIYGNVYLAETRKMTLTTSTPHHQPSSDSTRDMPTVRSRNDMNHGKKKVCHVALKQVSMIAAKNRIPLISDQPSCKEDAFMELKILKRIKNDNKKMKNNYVLELMDSFVENNTHMYIVTEFCSGGELFSLLESEGRLSYRLAQKYFIELMTGLQYLHKHRIIHRDISLENILIHEDGSIRICDFGVAKIGGGTWLNKDQNRCVRDSVGKDLYMSPQCYNASYCNNDANTTIEYDGYASDIWSCGIVLFMLLTGVFIYDIPCYSDPRFSMLADGDLSTLVDLWDFGHLIPPTLCKLIQGMLTVDESKRWSLSKIMKHSFITGILSGVEEITSVATSAISSPAMTTSPSISISSGEISLAESEIMEELMLDTME
jgi:serine/threonine protein kinase